MVRQTLKILQQMLQDFESMSDHCGTLCIIGLIAIFLVLGLVFYLEDLVVILIVNSNIFIVIVVVIVLIILYIYSQTEYHSGYSIFFRVFCSFFICSFIDLILASFIALF